MPLMKGRSKKAFSKNVETEMEHGKPQPQALAIAYSIKRKAGKKKMAEGGMAYKNDSVKSESRPMPEERDNDAKMVSQNSGNKPPSQDSWTDRPDIRQSQKGPKTTAIKHPRMVKSDILQVRLRDEEDDLQSSAGVNNGPQRQPPEHDNEEGADRQGPSTPSLKMKMMARGGSVMEPKDHGDEAMERHDEADLMDMESSSEDEGSSEAHSLNELDADGHNPNALDMEREHSNGRRPYAKGGSVDEELHHSPAGGSANRAKGAARSRNEGRQEGVNRSRSVYTPGESGMGYSVRGGHMEDAKKMAYQTIKEGRNVAGGKSKRPLEGMASGGSVRSGSSTMDYNEGGMIDDSLSHEQDMEHEDSIAAAIMAKKDRKKLMMSDSDMDEMVRLYHGGMYAEGGEINGRDSIYTHEDADQADLRRNAEEDANMEDQSSFDALRKENYSESEGLAELDSPMDSGEHGHELDSDDHDKVDNIRRKMMARRVFKQR